MAKNKKKAVDLKPTSITEEQLKSIQSLVAPINQAQMDLGIIETRKHSIMHDILELQKTLRQKQVELEKEYGKVNINIQDGTIQYQEDEQVNS
jgi:hypothetical protein|tara:strand:+ start:180 stop:458 length:279 start_codon:yes stop_codon:yes gene_type:complete